MPVISQRRSSILVGGKIYTTPTSTTGCSSADSTLSSVSSTLDRNSSYKSYLDRTATISRLSSPSKAYNSNTNGYLNSSLYSKYLPRSYSSYHADGSNLSGGSSSFSTYRGACKSLTNNDVNSSNRYTVNKRLKEVNNKFNDAKRLPPTADSCGKTSRGRSESCSSSASLARFVATSGLDIYEKYSPAYYKPKTNYYESKSPDLQNEAVSGDNNTTSQASIGLSTETSNRFIKSFSQQTANNTDDPNGTQEHPKHLQNVDLDNCITDNCSTNNIEQKPNEVLISHNVKNYNDNDENLLQIKFGPNTTHTHVLDSDMNTLGTMDNVECSTKEMETACSSDTFQNICTDKKFKNMKSFNANHDGEETKIRKNSSFQKISSLSSKSDLAAAVHVKERKQPDKALPPELVTTATNVVVKSPTISKPKKTALSSAKPTVIKTPGYGNTVSSNVQKGESKLGSNTTLERIALKNVAPVVGNHIDNTIRKNTNGNSNLTRDINKNRKNSKKVNAFTEITSNGMYSGNNTLQFNKASGSSSKKPFSMATTKTIQITPAFNNKLTYVANNSPYGSTKIGGRNQFKPLTLRNTGANRNPAIKLSKTSTNRNQIKRVNNNNFQDVFGYDNNSRMQTLSDRDDIKFIDSEDQSTSQSEQQATNISQANKGRVRPKSTVICSSPQSSSPIIQNNFHFKKDNNYKCRNAGGAANVSSSNIPTSKSTVTAVKSGEQHKAKSPVVDSNGIRASVDKFNKFNEHAHLSNNSSNNNKSSNNNSNNLSAHGHSSEFDSTTVRCKAPPKSTHNSSVVNTNAMSVNISSRHLLLSGNLNNTGSLPLNNSWNFYQFDDAATAEISHNTDRNLNRKNTVSMAGGLNDTSHTSARNSALSSRYWEGDISRSCLGTLAATTPNHISEVRKSSKNVESEGLCGLRNIGNTCFMNSIIQCLSHTEELTKFLRNYNTTKTSLSKDQQILNEFSKLIREMWTPNVRNVTPMELKRAFSAKHRMYSDYNQQDAQEFLRFFLDSLHSALNTGTKGDHLRIDDNLSDNNKADITWEWYCQHENSIIRDLFVGQLKSTLRCTVCGNTSVTFDPFWDLSVPLPSSSRCKLDACLNLFIQEEILDGDEMPTCSKCKTRRKCTKSFTIQRFPKYLVIHLKRFSETRWSKLSNIVEFPTGERELNMAPYGSNTNSNIRYSLYAISNHMGSTAGGHYVAVCKHPISKKWHEFNDNLVSDALLEHHLVSSSAYILFFERA